MTYVKLVFRRIAIITQESLDLPDLINSVYSNVLLIPNRFTLEDLYHFHPCILCCVWFLAHYINIVVFVDSGPLNINGGDTNDMG